MMLMPLVVAAVAEREGERDEETQKSFSGSWVLLKIQVTLSRLTA